MQPEVKEIAIYGAGGLGREVAAIIKYMIEKNQCEWNLIGFFDDGKKQGVYVDGLGVCLGGMTEINEWPTELNIILCFGSSSTLSKVSNNIVNPRIIFPNIVVPGVWISDKDSFRLGKGNIIMGSCEFTTNVTIGDFNLFNGHVYFGHDTKVGDCNVFMPGCRVSGNVSIGSRCTIGAMSFIHQQLSIGDDVTLGALSALLSKPKSGNTYIGNPAKRFKY